MGMCGGVLTGSGGGDGEGNVVADGMSGKAGGVAWQALGIKKRGKTQSQLLGSELEEARGRCAGPFPSLARDPTLHFPLY